MRNPELILDRFLSVRFIHSNFFSLLPHQISGLCLIALSLHIFLASKTNIDLLIILRMKFANRNLLLKFLIVYDFSPDSLRKETFGIRTKVPDIQTWNLALSSPIGCKNGYSLRVQSKNLII